MTDKHVVDAHGGLGADGDAVAVLYRVVFDEDVRAARFDHYVVIAGVDVAVVNPEISSRAGVDSIGIRRIHWREHFNALDGKVVHVFWHEMELG